MCQCYPDEPVDTLFTSTFRDSGESNAIDYHAQINREADLEDTVSTYTYIHAQVICITLKHLQKADQSFAAIVIWLSGESGGYSFR